jgi:hypothetical protein
MHGIVVPTDKAVTCRPRVVAEPRPGGRPAHEPPGAIVRPASQLSTCIACGTVQLPPGLGW